MSHSGNAQAQSSPGRALPLMDMGNDKQSHGKTPKSAKKPYQKPSFKHEKVFETMALACGKISPTQATCRSIKKNS